MISPTVDLTVTSACTGSDPRLILGYFPAFLDTTCLRVGMKISTHSFQGHRIQTKDSFLEINRLPPLIRKFTCPRQNPLLKKAYSRSLSLRRKGSFSPQTSFSSSPAHTKDDPRPASTGVHLLKKLVRAAGLLAAFAVWVQLSKSRPGSLFGSLLVSQPGNPGISSSQVMHQDAPEIHRSIAMLLHAISQHCM